MHELHTNRLSPSVHNDLPFLRGDLILTPLCCSACCILAAQCSPHSWNGLPALGHLGSTFLLPGDFRLPSDATNNQRTQKLYYTNGPISCWRKQDRPTLRVMKLTTFGGRRGTAGVAGEEGNGRLGALRRAAGVGYLGEAVVGADVERVGRVGAAGIYLLAVAIGTFTHCETHAQRWEFSVFFRESRAKIETWNCRERNIRSLRKT